MPCPNSTILLPARLQPHRPLAELDAVAEQNFPKSPNFLPDVVTHGVELVASSRSLTPLDKVFLWQLYARRVQAIPEYDLFASDYYSGPNHHLFAGRAGINVFADVPILVINDRGDVFRGRQVSWLLCCRPDYSQLTRI